MDASRVKNLALACLVAASLALTSCATQIEEFTATGSGGGGQTASSAPADDETSAETEPEEAPTSAALDPLTCLHGTWLADNAFFFAALREFGDEPTSVTGEVTLTFAPDGTLTTHYDAWQITASTEGHETVITREGIDRGTFTADETRITMNETDMGSTLAMNLAGTAMVIPAEPANYVGVAYTCAASDATINTPDGSVLLSRIPG